MATLAISTPEKQYGSKAFSTKLAGGRLPLLSSPKLPSPRTETIHVPSPPPSTPRPRRSIVTASPRPAWEGLPQSERTLLPTSAIRRKPRTRKEYGKTDRFIPNRRVDEAPIRTVRTPRATSSKQPPSVLAGAAYGLSLEGLSLNDDDDDNTSSHDIPHSKQSPDSIAYQSSLSSACDMAPTTRILSFQPKAPESSRPIDLRAVYNRPLIPRARGAQHRRRIATAPERVLDAPGLVDDYYLNVLDWSRGNQIAIALERQVYIWSAETGTVENLFETSAETYVSSVKWSNDGAHLGVGLGTGEVQIWDVEDQTKIRSMNGHEERVGVMGWNKHLLSTGDRKGQVFNHDVRIRQHKIADLVSHTLEVCGLEWRADGARLATGGNDNLVSIWDARKLDAPQHRKTNHNAAVKALAWCPWRNNLLATGGGSADGKIHFWNSTEGTRVDTVDTKSPVTGLHWSQHHKEIMSTGGFPNNSLTVWTYPELVKSFEVGAHEARILHSSMSPDGTVLATAGPDESMKFWRVGEGTKGGERGAGLVKKEGGEGDRSGMAGQLVIR
ncbi:hypothetical protein W97_08704 [Coniosporium apollinis CBS 100218]|uniref:CDC20/Fizzy WD40 domain-containing protein n=1 Tax=Coniosporium apollinis (strain CBS 100218) TaxID=1168221 RepID=R7Z5Z4_CONA1|nr:uncharacterized protein W97_08704 [Coniosporium apollinis CBS 100218]EON69444.1 hypothetical protein W97_08704 [Coniosporium apollinis CBS 100218]